MSTQVRTFVANVEDRDDWCFDGAFVAIHRASETSQTTYESKDCSGVYELDVSSHVIKYKAQFWKDHQTQLDGKPSRALYSKTLIEQKEGYEGYEHIVEYDYSEIFTVDLENEQAKRIFQNSGTTKEETIFNLIEFDLKRRVEQ